jgi:hypothetical protein
VSADPNRAIEVRRSVLFGIGRDITTGNLSAAAQTVIDLLAADVDAEEAGQ